MANVIVTGGSRGIGLAVVQTLAASNYTEIAVARQETKELAVAREQASESIYFIPFDLSEVGKAHSQSARTLWTDLWIDQ